MSLIHALNDMADAAHVLGHGDWKIMAERIERRIKERWPDRAYFIEVGRDSEGWVQLFQPYNIPRDTLIERTVIPHEPGCFAQPRTARGCHCGRDHQ